MKEINMKIKVVKDPYSYYFLPYADVYGSVFCFSAVFLGIVSVLFAHMNHISNKYNFLIK
jgi:hypothetical protein